MENPTIQRLLDEGRARYSFRWTCSSTISSGELDAAKRSSHVDSCGYVAWLDQQAIRGTVRVELRILATEDLLGYRVHGQHSDFGDSTFNLMAGDIIADGGFFDFVPDKLYDPLEPPLGSCFQFRSEPDRKREVSILFHNDEHVLVVMSKKSIDGFASLAHRPDLQISSVVLPALMGAIQFIKDNRDPSASSEDLSGRLWVRPIVDQVERVGSWDDPVFQLAQRILGYCMDKSLEFALHATDAEDE